VASGGVGVIVKTGAKMRGSRTYGLVYYLMGPGRSNEHVDPRVIAGYKPADQLNPPGRSDGRAGADIRDLVAALDRPVRRLGDRAPERHVFHTVIANRPDDPVLTDEQWADVAYDLMRELRLAGTDQGARDIRWVAIRHDAAHIHLAGTLVRADGSVATTPNDFRAGSAVRARMEARYGLARTNSGDRTSTQRPARAETEKAARQGRGEPERDTLRRLVRGAASTARSAEEFRSELAASGARFTPRMSTQDPTQVTGYKVSLLPADSAAQTVWFAGGQLDKDLTWPRLTARWEPAVAPADSAARPAAASARDGSGREGAGQRGAPVTTSSTTGFSPAAMSSSTGAASPAERAAAAAERARERVDAIRAAEFRVRAAGAALRADPALVDAVAPATADLAAATSAAWQRRPDGRRPVAGFTRAGDAAQRAGRTPGGGPPAYSAQSAAMRAAVRRMVLAGQLTGGSDTAAWLSLAAQLAVTLDAIATARAAQQRADQAAAARDGAAPYRAELEHAARDPAAAGAPPLVQVALRRAGPPGGPGRDPAAGRRPAEPPAPESRRTG